MANYLTPTSICQESSVRGRNIRFVWFGIFNLWTALLKLNHITGEIDLEGASPQEDDQAPRNI